MVNIFVAPNGKIPTLRGRIVSKEWVENLQRNVCGMPEAEMLYRAFAGLEIDWRHEWLKQHSHS